MCGLDVHTQRSACGEWGGGMEWAGRGGRRVGARGALAALTAALLAGGLQLTTPGSMGRAEIPHVRGAERAAFRLSLAGGEPFPVYGLVHRSPHPLAISLFTVRVERVRYVHVQVSLRRSVLSALSIRYRDTTIDVWTYGNRYTLRTGYARASSSSVRSTDTTE
jgi:hypothetical protein